MQIAAHLGSGQKSLDIQNRRESGIGSPRRPFGTRRRHVTDDAAIRIYLLYFNDARTLLNATDQVGLQNASGAGADGQSNANSRD